MSRKPEVSAGPSRPTHRVQSAADMVDEIGDAIYLVDVLIGKWADQLNRAQPHRNGRLVIRFGKNTGVRHGGEVKYDIEPIVGKMIQMQSGSWSFFKLTARDKYERLSDLRVGKTLKSDPLVLRLINGIEELLKQRETLCSALVNLKLMHNEVSKAGSMPFCVERPCLISLMPG